MKLLRNAWCCMVLLCMLFSTANAQLYKIALTDKINKAALVVEGRVTRQQSFWNDAHTVIYTASKIHIYKLFKGQVVPADVEVITQGGTVGNRCLIVSDVLQLRKDETGMFFLNENALKIQSPFTKRNLYDVYSSAQGFLRYDETTKKAFAPFAEYDNIEQTLYNLIRQQTGIKEKIIDNSLKPTSGGVVSNGTSGAVITSFSPATVHAGAISDPANNILTINGSGFGNNPSSKAGIKFKDANNGNTDPDYKIAYNSPYIISWTDTKITVRVPGHAATGAFAVVLDDGTSVKTATDLQVFFAVLDSEFQPGSQDVVREGRLMNTDNSGGYTIQYSTSTLGGGKDFTASPAKQTFQRAMATWKEIAGANFTEGLPTTVQKVDDDGINVVVFDNNNTGVAKMADGVLESTYSWFSTCLQGTEILTAQKTGFDIVIRNENVSTGKDVSFEFGPCFPAQGSYDLEMIILHELGHALNLGHINDDYENGGSGYPTINPSKLMHYAILDYVDRRSPDASAYQGVLYTTTPQHNTYGNCGLFDQEMQVLPTLAIANDECPSTFPSTALKDNTVVTFDLTHATSNKFGDPSFEQVNCKNTGTSVTNNAYYAFTNGTKTDLNLNITGYTTLPADLNSCAGQATRLALYDVQSCPAGQAYPQPVACVNFNGNGIIDFKGVQQNHKYLLYLDGARNTKAFFNIEFNTDSTSTNPPASIEVFPNPVTTGNLNIRITSPSSSFYEYALFDAVGRLLVTGKISTTLPAQTFQIGMQNVAAGMYFLRLVDETGKTVIKKKIVKQN